MKIMANIRPGVLLERMENSRFALAVEACAVGFDVDFGAILTQPKMNLNAVLNATPKSPPMLIEKLILTSALIESERKSG